MFTGTTVPKKLSANWDIGPLDRRTVSQSVKYFIGMTSMLYVHDMLILISTTGIPSKISVINIYMYHMY